MNVRLFVQKRAEENASDEDGANTYTEPVKLDMYRKIFNEHFNIA